MMTHKYISTIEVLEFNTKTGHEFYTASVQSDDGELYLAVRAGYQRWNKRLADALAGGGYFIGEQYARSAADKMCETYKDFDSSEIVVKKLDIAVAVEELHDAISKMTL